MIPEMQENDKIDYMKPIKVVFFMKNIDLFD